MKQSNENIVTVHNTEELAALDKKTYCYTASQVIKSYEEDFIDEDSGEIVTLNRTETVFEKGEALGPDDFSELLFRFQTGDITEARLSNVQRQGSMSSGLFIPWIVKADGTKKIKFLIRADSASLAYDVAKDYIELNYRGSFNIESIKTFEHCVIIEPEDGENLNISADRWWYQVSVEAMQQDDGEEPVVCYSEQFVVFAENVENAKAIIDRYVAKKRAESGDAGASNIVFKTTSASIISFNVVVPAEFCLPYSKKFECSQV